MWVPPRPYRARRARLLPMVRAPHALSAPKGLFSLLPARWVVWPAARATTAHPAPALASPRRATRVPTCLQTRSLRARTTACRVRSAPGAWGGGACQRSAAWAASPTWVVWGSVPTARPVTTRTRKAARAARSALVADLTPVADLPLTLLQAYPNPVAGLPLTLTLTLIPTRSARSPPSAVAMAPVLPRRAPPASGVTAQVSAASSSARRSSRASGHPPAHTRPSTAPPPDSTARGTSG